VFSSNLYGKTAAAVSNVFIDRKKALQPLDMSSLWLSDGLVSLHVVSRVVVIDVQIILTDPRWQSCWMLKPGVYTPVGVG
jgi:hypothetical protein